MTGFTAYASRPELVDLLITRVRSESGESFGTSAIGEAGAHPRQRFLDVAVPEGLVTEHGHDGCEHDHREADADADAESREHDREDDHGGGTGQK